MNLKRYETRTVITDNPEALAVEVTQLGRGASAKVVDGGRFQGQEFYGSTPRMALDCLLAALATCPLCGEKLKDEKLFHMTCAEREQMQADC